MSTSPNHQRGHGRIPHGGCGRARCGTCHPEKYIAGRQPTPAEVRAKDSERQQRAEVEAP